MSSLSGTYSLAPTAANHWEYEDAKVWVAFGRTSGSSPSQSLAVVPKIDFAGSHTTYLGTTTATAKGATGASIYRDCDTANANRYTSSSHDRIKSGATWADTATGYLDGSFISVGLLASFATSVGTWWWRPYYETTPRTGAYDAASRLPFSVTSQAGILLQRTWANTYTESSNTFPLYSAPTPIGLSDRFVFYHFEYEFSVDAVRLVYPGLTLPHFADPYPTASGFSYV